MGKATTDLLFAEPCVGAIQAVRSDSDPTDWCTMSYEDDSHVGLHGTGTGGLAEFRASFDVNARQLGLLRLLDHVDGHPTTKFVMVKWAGDNVSVVRKARMTVQAAAMLEFIGQSHLTVDASAPEDLSDEIIVGRIQDGSGSGSRVLAGMDAGVRAAPVPEAKPAGVAAPVPKVERAAAAPKAAEPARPKPSGQGRPSVSRQSQGLAFDDEAAMRAALHAVRNDADPSDWVLFGYKDQTNTLALFGGGQGGTDELKALLRDDNVFYGVVRVIDVIDGHNTVKFCFILFLGENVRVVRKARIATHKGAVQELIGQYHASIEATQLDEVSQGEVMRVVGEASGTLSHVQ